jgi:hypothetical protein
MPLRKHPQPATHLSASLIPSNSSMQHTPPSASTSAPASRVHEPPSLTAAAVRPAALEERPEVTTACGESFATYCKIWLLPAEVGAHGSIGSRRRVYKPSSWAQALSLPPHGPCAPLPLPLPTPHIPPASQPHTGAWVPHKEEVDVTASAGAAIIPLPCHAAHQHEQSCQLDMEEAIELRTHVCNNLQTTSKNYCTTDGTKQKYVCTIGHRHSTLSLELITTLPRTLSLHSSPTHRIPCPQGLMCMGCPEALKAFDHFR